MNNDQKSLIINESSNPNLVNKTFFLNKNNRNYLNITYDTQGITWIGNRRNISLKRYLTKHKGFRINPKISQKELNERNNFHKNTNKDLFYQFNSFYANLPIYITHLQVRKNFKQIDKELFYTKQFGIEGYDILHQKQQTLIGLDEIEANKSICFDLIKKANGDFLLCLGKTDGTCELLQITKDDYMQVKVNKVSNNAPQYKRIFALNELDEETFVNYVFFIANNRLISTNNDKCLHIYDLNKDYQVIFKVQNNEAINHCDINEEIGIIACVGDSYSIDLIDIRAKNIVTRIYEHYDFGIVVKFNQYDNNYFATGNQDYSCRIWDIRMRQKSLYQLQGFCDSIGDLVWAKRNRIIYGENSIYAHVYDLDSHSLQSLTYLGTFNGVVHNAMNDKLYVAIYDDNEGGIIEYNALSHCYSNIQNMNL